MMQLKKHEHGRYVTNIALSDAEILKEFVVYPGVLRPESMTSLFLARHLNRKKSIYNNKTVIDVGCGSGIQGVVMGIGGARRVVLSDISPQLVSNAMENINNFQLSDRAEVVQSDLFENIKESFDVIVFNHPFFPADPIENIPVSISMLDSGDLIHRFFEEAKGYLNKDGVIIMPYLQLAGEINDPKVQGLKHNFSIELAFHHNAKVGLQKGQINIYHLKLKD